jgi:competence protein ComEA
MNNRGTAPRRALLAQSLLIGLAVFLWVAGAEGKKKPPATPLDLNSATPEQLEQLPGIGPSAAQAIVNFRTKSGPFRRVEDLLAIRGISQRKLDQIRPYVTVGGGPGAKPQPPKKSTGLHGATGRVEKGSLEKTLDVNELHPLVGHAPWRDGQRYLVGYLEAVAFERDDLPRVVGQNAQPGEAQIGQNLRADSALMLQ